MGKGRKVMSMKSSDRLTAQLKRPVRNAHVALHRVSKYSKAKQPRKDQLS